VVRKVCTKCHVEKSISEFCNQSDSADGLRRWCKACDKDYRAANKERRAALNRGYYERNPRTEYYHNRYLANKINHMATMKLWRSKNPERVVAMAREWRRNNPERVKAQRHLRSQAVRNANENARRARKRGAGGVYTSKDVARIFELQRGKCPVCRVTLDSKFHRDHIVPLARGGTNHPDNIQLLCAHCNQTKHARDPYTFMQSRGFLL